MRSRLFAVFALVSVLGAVSAIEEGDDPIAGAGEAIGGGCTPQARRDAAVLGLDVLRCVLANQGETEAEVYAKCARDGVSKEDVLKMLAEAREQTAAAAAKAACGAPDSGQ